MAKNADKLLFRRNLSTDTTDKMARFRKQAYKLAVMLEEFGDSSETTLAFRHIQQAVFFTNAHLCYVDLQAEMEALPED